MHAYVSATGLACLAYLPKPQLLQILPDTPEAWTPGTLTDRDALMRELARICSRGYARRLGTIRTGVGGIAEPLREVDDAWVDALLVAQAAERGALIARETVAMTAIDLLHEADFLCRGQTHVMRMQVPSPGFPPQQVRLRFEALYRERFDVDLSEMKPILAAPRTTVIGRRERPKGFEAAARAPARAEGAMPAAHRRGWFGGAWVDTPVYLREALAPGAVLEGPAIVEQLDTNTVVETTLGLVRKRLRKRRRTTMRISSRSENRNRFERSPDDVLPSRRRRMVQLDGLQDSAAGFRR